MIGTGRALGAQAPADLEAVHPRQHHVEHDEVEGLLGEARERLAAVGRLHDLVAVALQREREQRLDRLLVVDEQDAGGAVGHDALQPRIVGACRYPRCGARRPGLPGCLPPRAGRAVRRRLLARGPAGARAHARCRPTRSTPRARSATRAAAAQLAAASSAARSRTAQPGSAGDAALADRVAATLRGRRLRRRPAARPTRRAPSTASATSRRWSACARALEPPDRRARPPRRARRARARRAVRHRGAARARARVPGRASCARRSCSSRPRAAAAGFAGARAWARAQRRRADRRRDRARRPRRRARRASRGSCRGRTAREPPPLGARSGRSRRGAARGRRATRAARGRSPSGSRRALPLTVSEQGEVGARGAARRAAAGLRRARPGADAPVSRDAARRLRPRGAARGHARSTRPAPRDGEAAPAFADEPTGIVTLRNVLPDWACGCSSARCCCRRCWPRSTRSSAPAAAGSPVGALARLGGSPPRCRSCSPGCGCAVLGVDRRARRAARRRSCPLALPLERPARSRALASAALGARARRGSARAARARAARRACAASRGRRRRGRRPPGVVIVRRSRALVWVRQPVRRGAAAAGRAPVAVRRRARHAAARLAGWSRSWRRAGRCRSLLVALDYVALGARARSSSRGCGCVAAAGGHVSASVGARRVGCVAGCVAGARARAARAPPRRGRRARPEPHPTRAARSATPGPGSLGGTESALRR